LLIFDAAAGLGFHIEHRDRSTVSLP
jgi:hypothetical protein